MRNAEGDYLDTNAQHSCIFFGRANPPRAKFSKATIPFPGAAIVDSHGGDMKKSENHQSVDAR